MPHLHTLLVSLDKELEILWERNPARIYMAQPHYVKFDRYSLPVKEIKIISKFLYWRDWRPP